MNTQANGSSWLTHSIFDDCDHIFVFLAFHLIEAGHLPHTKRQNCFLTIILAFSAAAAAADNSQVVA